MSAQPLHLVDLDEVALDEETMSGLRELGVVLLGIHKRLISEGYTVKDGRIYKTM